MIATAFERPSRGFSLTEVVIALGVAVAGLLLVLAILPGLLRQPAEARQTHIALGLPGAVTAELGRHAGHDLAGLAGRAADFGAGSSPLRLVAAADGSDVRVPAGDEDGAREQFFLIELHRFPAHSPLAASGNASFVALQARVSWPYRPAASSGSEVPAELRGRLTFNLALHR